MALVEWIQEAEALQRIGKSARTLERLVQAGEIESKLAARPGRRPERLFGAASLERHANQSEEQQIQPRPPAARQALPSPTPAGLQIITEAIATTANNAMAAWRDRPVSLSEKLWLTLKEARAYSGLGRKDLLSLAEQGKVQTRISGRSRVFRRASLEAFGG